MKDVYPEGVFVWADERRQEKKWVGMRLVGQSLNCTLPVMYTYFRRMRAACVHGSDRSWSVCGGMGVGRFLAFTFLLFVC